MDYRQLLPHPALARFVRCYWILRGDGAPEGDIEEIVPDGSPELVINLADRFCQVRADGRRERQPEILVAGQMSRPLRIAPSGRVDLVGIRFRPAGLFAFLGGERLDSVTEARIDLEAIDGRWARRLRNAARGPSDSHALGGVEQALFERLTPSSSSAAEAGAARIEASGGLISPRELAAELGVGQRALQRCFRTEIGIRPKLLARIVRFQRVMRSLETTSWAQIALACGYYDQAHLIRDFRTFAGKPPRAWAAAGTTLGKLLSGLDTTRQRRRSAAASASPGLSVSRS